MRTITHVVFEQQERFVFDRLSGFGYAIGFDSDGGARLLRYLNRVKNKSPLDRKALADLEQCLVELHGVFWPQQEESWWKQGAPRPIGAEVTPFITQDAIKGLAEGRRHDIAAIENAMDVVANALRLIPLDEEVFVA